MKESKLRINDFRLWLHLGCSKEERFHPQAVSIDVEIIFQDELIATKNDNLKEVFCYKNCVEMIQKNLQNLSFNLIEHLSYKIYEIVQNLLIEKNYKKFDLKVIVTKLSPPIPNLYGSVSFSYNGVENE